MLQDISHQLSNTQAMHLTLVIDSRWLSAVSQSLQQAFMMNDATQDVLQKRLCDTHYLPPTPTLSSLYCSLHLTLPPS